MFTPLGDIKLTTEEIFVPVLARVGRAVVGFIAGLPGPRRSRLGGKC